ncbi:ABC transporter ATP-binding protein [Rhodococcus sp. 15-649-1-2]|nr:ATP-binding cassette domain-containing protein [Rhodococcus sp. 15-649-1-2]OZE79149.1 ABC transporter ATP-binding protein [Rhodococcus sp. 15-649-1-2]
MNETHAVIDSARTAESTDPGGSTSASSAHSGSAEIVLRLDDVNKSYPGVHALKGVSLTVRRGEVHALVGENGAGKSTLVGVAAGSVTADSGTVEIGGVASSAPTPSWCRERGLAIVYQEPALLPDLTVAENMRLGMPDEIRPAVGQQNRWAETILGKWSSVAAIDARTPVRELQPDARFVVEIARALAEEPKVIILDEPTEHLLPAAVKELFRLIDELIESGSAVVYISHRLNEVKQIAHSVSVLRDGALVGTFDGGSVTEQDVINLVVGREITVKRTQSAARHTELGAQLLEVRGFSGERFNDLELTIRAGEIVGFAGIEGQGQRDVLRALGGLESNSGTVELNGTTVHTSSATKALAGGICYVTHDRHNEGILPGLSLRENSSLSALGRFLTGGVLSKGLERKETTAAFSSLQVKAPSPEVDITTLSGGNQQKVVLSRALMTNSAIILADEPTQGVDVGAREEIYQILRSASATGSGIIVLSSSAAELEQICDRVVVFSRGKAVRELVGDEVSEHAIAHAALTATGSRAKTVVAPSTTTPMRRFSRSDLSPAAILALATIMLGIVATVQSDFYLTPRNLGLVLPLVATLAFFAMAQQVVMMVGGIDLSVGPLAGMLVVTGSFVLSAYKTPVGMVLGVLTLVLVAAAAGSVNWFLVVKVKINPLIATLVTFTALQGVAYTLRPLPEGQIDPVFLSYVSTKFGFVPLMVLIALAVALATEFALRRTLFGIHLRAVGSEPSTASRVGLSSNRVLLMAYVGCSVLVVPAALLLMAQAGTGNASIGDSYTLASIGAAVLGGASIFGGRGSFIGAVLGAVLVIQINTVVQFLDLELYWQQWLLGGLTVIAAAFYSKTRAIAERK